MLYTFIVTHRLLQHPVYLPQSPFIHTTQNQTFKQKVTGLDVVAALMAPTLCNALPHEICSAESTPVHYCF